MTTRWRTDIENAPRDGSEVLFPIEFVGRAYWCSDLKRWVLSYPLHMEYVSHPTKFMLPVGSMNGGLTESKEDQ